MNTYIKSAILAMALVTAAVPSFAQAAYAEAAPVTSAASTKAKVTTLQNQAFTKKKYKIKGNWTVVQDGDQILIRFSDDFKTKNGPDLKVFLSPLSVADATGKNATNGAVSLGVLKSKKGTQDYILPAGVSLANFNSVLIHCEAFSVLWGGGDLN